MERVRIDQRLRINVRGFDPEATTYEVGEHEVAASVAAYVRAHPEFGSVIDEESPSPSPVTEDDSGRASSPESSEETSDEETSDEETSDEETSDEETSDEETSDEETSEPSKPRGRGRK